MMIKTLTAVAIATAAFASPVFAQDATAPQKPVHQLRQHYRSTYNEVQEPAFVAPRAPVGSSFFDKDSFDRARIGDHDPDFNPPS